MSNNLLEQLEQERFLPLYTATDLNYLKSAAEILLEHGLHFIEVTYRSDLASQAIEELTKYPDLVVGAGTVRNLETAKEAIKHGAKFIVTPGLDEKIVRYCQEQDIPVVPGAVTPTEIMQANELGLSVVKFFPANIYGGLAAIKALSGPFADVRFVPTGGVTLENYPDFLANPHILAVGGSFILSEKLLINDNAKAQSILDQLTKNK
ncbi:bifunctional 4-hydroxy-2-oxoglutarate aldolase/2-dehydro-3-deoxy-phosphogluconate aldolase [Enterococcus asini]|nr:bifunctional 4-hydroxy-2-oxoglutarate aldolase/2-dehydro-3-deoxy-phosphogluconate aldolase [Enterococcus asini]MCD5028064.1 bifunctional 4-hydroxy-2-oxoglutarate aldolase/2-dehydro-3-deoxy-phosphogluconate aldolase [Enterococcus asini]MDT2783766.1 bifunctional 4-hydroxy-2-oxoglutarate aldolase/2-dehydro-3-deoxy-phosphogluconate aldolase [Enterococcus asini]